MKKSKKFILAVIVILVAAIAIILLKPDLVDSEEPVKGEESEEVQETSQELRDEIFD